MALPASGQISINDIYTEASGSCYTPQICLGDPGCFSLNSLAADFRIPQNPDNISEFYGLTCCDCIKWEWTQTSHSDDGYLIFWVDCNAEEHELKLDSEVTSYFVCSGIGETPTTNEGTFTEITTDCCRCPEGCTATYNVYSYAGGTISYIDCNYAYTELVIAEDTTVQPCICTIPVFIVGSGTVTLAFAPPSCD